MPLLAAIGGSIQNDYLTASLLIAMCLVLGDRACCDGAIVLCRFIFCLGVLIGVAVLSKIVALALVPALVLALPRSSGVDADDA